MTHSIIIPYQHSPERLPLLLACLGSIVTLSNNKFEICVHEVGPSQHLNLPKRYKYLYTPYKGIFHRAWALNRGARELATGDILILMDGDLIVTPEWVDRALKCKTLSMGWDKLSLLTKEGTSLYIRTNYLYPEMISKTKSPAMGSAAGAAMIIPSNLFYSVKGIPEDFEGSWGGEDNAFWAKLKSLGHEIKSIKGTLYHLDHSPSTPRVRKIQEKVFPMLYWTKAQWKEYNNSLNDNWGMEIPDIYSIPSISYISTIKGPRLTLAMLSWLRYDKLINTLNSLYETLTIPINLTLRVQGAEELSKSQRRTIRTLADKFSGSDVYFTQGNEGTGPARKSLAKRALHRFHTPYINLADDDTTYTDGSVEAAIKLLDSDLSLGIVGIRYKPRIYMLDSLIKPRNLVPQDATKDLEIVDCTGSASAIIRREVFDLCKIDPYYTIGQWDLDLFLQARSIGWKIANYKAFPSMAAINDWGGSPKYKKARLNHKGIKRSVKYFKQKWGLKRAA